MVYSAEDLNENEEIVLNLRPHWWFFAKNFVLLIITFVIGMVVLFTEPGVILAVAGVAPFILAFLWFLSRFLVWSTTSFVVTTDRLANRSGVFNRQGIEIPLERVNTVFFSQNLFERIIGSGDLVIESAGEQGRQKFTDIRKPLNVQNEIHHQMEDNENRKFDRVSEGVSSVAAAEEAKVPIPEQIEKLDELRKKKIISKEEFEAKKRQLLDRM